MSAASGFILGVVQVKVIRSWALGGSLGIPCMSSSDGTTTNRDAYVYICCILDLHVKWLFICWPESKVLTARHVCWPAFNSFVAGKFAKEGFCKKIAAVYDHVGIVELFPTVSIWKIFQEGFKEQLRPVFIHQINEYLPMLSRREQSHQDVRHESLLGFCGVIWKKSYHKQQD